MAWEWKRVRLSVGKDAQDAIARRQRKEAELNALNNGVAVRPNRLSERRSIATAVAEFLDETELTKKPNTLAAYSTGLKYFTESCSKLLLDDIERKTCWSSPPFSRTRRTGSPIRLQQVRKFDDVPES
jgi:hypothetical protein